MLGISPVNYGCVAPVSRGHVAEQQAAIYNPQKKQSTTNNVVKTAAVLGTVALAVVYRKKIGSFLKELFPKIKNLFKKAPQQIKNAFNGEKVVARNAVEAATAAETLAIKNSAAAEVGNKIAADFEKSLRATKGAVHAQKQKMYDKLFANV